MKNENLSHTIDLRSLYHKEYLEKNWYIVKKKKDLQVNLKFIKKLIVIAWFILFFLTIYINYFYLKTEAKKVYTEQEKIRLSRIKACEKYAKVKKIYWQNSVTRCATFMTVVFAYESNFWKSNICLNRKNCFWMKWNWVEYPAGFINFRNFDEANNFFAKKYFKYHYKKKVEDFVYSWSMTDRQSYIYFFRKNYQKIYSEIENLRKKYDMK